MLPEEAVGKMLSSAGLSLAVAESCTGGLICHRITNVPGSSRYFGAGFVTYGDNAKETVLGVGHEILAEQGAVSESAAAAMARGARRAAGAQVGLAVTGIAGPGGGSPEKPVGLVFMAVDGPHGTKVARHIFGGSRLEIKNRSATAALEMLRKELDAIGHR